MPGPWVLRAAASARAEGGGEVALARLGSWECPSHAAGAPGPWAASPACIDFGV